MDFKDQLRTLWVQGEEQIQAQADLRIPLYLQEVTIEIQQWNWILEQLARLGDLLD